MTTKTTITTTNNAPPSGAPARLTKEQAWREMGLEIKSSKEEMWIEVQKARLEVNSVRVDRHLYGPRYVERAYVFDAQCAVLNAWLMGWIEDWESQSLLNELHFLGFPYAARYRDGETK